MFQQVCAFGTTIVAAVEEDRVTATCQRGWEDTSDWDLLANSLSLKGSEIEDWFPHSDGSETFVIPRQRTR